MFSPPPASHTYDSGARRASRQPPPGADQRRAVSLVSLSPRRRRLLAMGSWRSVMLRRDWAHVTAVARDQWSDTTAFRIIEGRGGGGRSYVARICAAGHVASSLRSWDLNNILLSSLQLDGSGRFFNQPFVCWRVWGGVCVSIYMCVHIEVEIELWEARSNEYSSI